MKYRTGCFLFVVLGLISTQVYPEVIEYKASDAGYSNNISANEPASGNIWSAVNQSFKAVDSNIFFAFDLGNHASTSQPVVCNLREGDGNSGALLEARPLSISASVFTPTLFEVDFSLVSLRIGQRYTVEISPVTQPDVGDYSPVSAFYAGTGAPGDTSNPYDGGKFYYSGSSYDRSFPDRDIAFRITGVARPETLVLNVDTQSQELFLTGSDSGFPSDSSSPDPNRIQWEQPGFLPFNVQGVGLPVSGITLNLNVSTSSDAIALVAFDVEGSVDLVANGDRVDYSWMQGEVKQILTNCDGIRLQLTKGSGFDLVSVRVLGAPETEFCWQCLPNRGGWRATITRP